MTTDLQSLFRTRYGHLAKSPLATDSASPRPGRSASRTSRSRVWWRHLMNKHVVLVTGALTGIGRAAALGFARAGNTVIISGRHGAAGQALVTELKATGADAAFIGADIRREAEVA